MALRIADFKSFVLRDMTAHLLTKNDRYEQQIAPSNLSHSSMQANESVFCDETFRSRAFMQVASTGQQTFR